MIDWKCTLQRWAWWCPYGMLGLAIAIPLLFGLSFWTALLIAMLLVCPVVIVWGAIQVWRRKPRKTGGMNRDLPHPPEGR